jgi:hypothetical protein
MKRILMVMTVIALAAISYGSLGLLSNAPDVRSSILTTAETIGIGTVGSITSGVFYLCEGDAEAEEAPADEGKPDEPAPGIDRTWNVVMYG